MTGEILGNATYTKLRDGSWGARVTGKNAEFLCRGCRIAITTKAGKTQFGFIKDVLWSGDDRDGERVTLCSLRSYEEYSRSGRCHTDGDCSSFCIADPENCPCAEDGWFRCC